MAIPTGTGRGPSGPPERLPPPLLSADETAAWIGVRTKQVYELVRRGDLRAKRVGRKLRFRPEWVVEWVERREP